MTGGHRPAWTRRSRRDAPVRRTIEDLATALTARDDHGIRAVLRPDVELVIDTGDVPPAARTSSGAGSAGSETRRDAAVAGLRRLMTDDVTVMTASVNGTPGLLLVRTGAVIGVVTAHPRGRLLANVWVVSNPDKLRHWNR